MPSVLVLNGPNLNLLGTRKPEIYGSTTLADVEELCRRTAGELGLEIVFRQSNHEGQLIDWIHEFGAEVRAGRSIGAVYNPGAHTHTSVALHDAIEGVSLPVIELHISNVHAREEFRHRSFISPVARGIVVGFGVTGYPLAIRGLHQLHRSTPSEGSVQVIHTDNAPSHNGPVPQAVLAGGWIYVSALFGADPVVRAIPEDGRAEAEQLFTNLAAILAAAGAKLSDVVRVGIVMRDLHRDRPVFNEVWAERFGDHRPARSAIQSPDFGRAGEQARFMIEVAAYRG